MKVQPGPIPADNRILYFGRDRESFGFLSHFHPAPIRLDGDDWPTVEHYYQAQKSDDPDYQAAIRAAPHAAAAKQLSAAPDLPDRRAQHSWFRQHGKAPRSDWDGLKLEVMRRADFAKFSQNPDLGALLLATGTAELIEDSPSETFWGSGPDGTGENWAGRILMEVRARLR